MIAGATAAITSTPMELSTSTTPSGLSAESTPKLRPTTTIISAASAVSSNVGPMRGLIASATDCCWLIESPRSPLTARPTQLPYCTKNGSSRWYFARSAWRVSGETRFPPSSAASGLPGARYVIEKITNDAARSSSGMMRTRLMTTSSMR